MNQMLQMEQMSLHQKWIGCKDNTQYVSKASKYS